MADIFETVKNLPPKKIGALVAVIALTTAALTLGYSWFQKADYQLLYANLGEEDAGQIIQKLSEMRIPYAASPGGVMVPADKVYELRLQLASQGLLLERKRRRWCFGASTQRRSARSPCT